MKILMIMICITLSQASWTGGDDVGQVGRVIGMKVFDEDSHTFSSRQMNLTVMEDVDNQGNPITITYASKGTSCQQRGISPSNYGLLQTAMSDKHTRIRPLYVPGLGNIRCIVGFTLIQMPQFEDHIN